MRYLIFAVLLFTFQFCSSGPDTKAQRALDTLNGNIERINQKTDKQLLYMRWEMEQIQLLMLRRKISEDSARILVDSLALDSFKKTSEGVPDWYLEMKRPDSLK